MLVYAREPILPAEANLLSTVKQTDTLQLRERALADRAMAVQNIHGKQQTDKIYYDDKHRHVYFLFYYYYIYILYIIYIFII